MDALKNLLDVIDKVEDIKLRIEISQALATYIKSLADELIVPYIEK